MRKQALVPIQRQGTPPIRRVANWDWDFQIEGYVATAAVDFSCECGALIPTPSHTRCKCGKLWNSYVIGSAGEGREASIDKFVCREVPIRDNVIVAGRKRVSVLDKLYGESVRHLSAQKKRHYNNTMSTSTAREESMRMGQLDKLYKEALQNQKSFPMESPILTEQRGSRVSLTTSNHNLFEKIRSDPSFDTPYRTDGTDMINSGGW